MQNQLSLKGVSWDTGSMRISKVAASRGSRRAMSSVVSNVVSRGAMSSVVSDVVSRGKMSSVVSNVVSTEVSKVR